MWETVFAIVIAVLILANLDHLLALGVLVLVLVLALGIALLAVIGVGLVSLLAFLDFPVTAEQSEYVRAACALAVLAGIFWLWAVVRRKGY